MKKNKTLHVGLLILAVFGLTASLYSFGAFYRMEGMFHDTATGYVRKSKSVSKNVAVILIDEASLQALNPLVGRWPWPRAIYSDLLDFLAMGKPRAVVFDVLFTERTATGGGMDPNDVQLVKTTAEKGFVYHAMQILRDVEDEKNHTLLNRPLPQDFAKKFSVEVNGSPKGGAGNTYYIPYKELYQATKGVAVVEFTPDPDGVYRSTRPLREYQGRFYPVAGLAPLVRGETAEALPNEMQIGGRKIPLDENGKYLINVYGKFNEYSISGLFASLQKIRAGEVESLMVDPSEFKDKIVFIGSSAVGVEDLKATSISPSTPGVFLHASLASNYIENDFLYPPNRGYTLLATYLISVLCVSGIFVVKRFWVKGAIPITAIIIWGVFCVQGLAINTVYEAVPPISAALLSGIFGFGYVAMTEGREKGKIRKMFSQYVSPEVLTIMMDHPDEFASIGAGKRAEISILFSDIRSFTTFSEKSSPEQVVDMLNSHFHYMTDPIIQSKGTVDKFIGDAIMAFWGAPVKLENHAQAAVWSALEMKRKMALVNAEIKTKGIDWTISIGIGINSGDAIIGNIGSEKKVNYTVIGDAVNLASRLESITKNYGVLIIISESTRSKLSGDIPCRVLDSVRVKGKEIPVKIYEPLDCYDEESRQKSLRIAAITNEAFEKYEMGDYKGCMELYNKLEDVQLKEIYKKRCEEGRGPGPVALEKDGAEHA